MIVRDSSQTSTIYLNNGKITYNSQISSMNIEKFYVEGNEYNFHKNYIHR